MQPPQFETMKIALPYGVVPLAQKLNGHPSASRHVYIGSAHVECDVSYQTRFENAFALRNNLN